MTPLAGAVAAPPQGGAYNSTQLQQLWVQNGGPAAVAPLMAAIALAESGGHPQSVNATDNNGTQTSWGLWQISNGTHNQPVANILDPNVNAQAAVAKYRSQGLGAWGTYTSGAYKQYLGGNAATLASASSMAGTLTNTCTPVISLGPIGTLLNSCQAQEIVGALLMGIGAVAVVVGFGVILADVGLRKSAPAIIGAVAGNRAGKRSSERRMAEREHASGLRTQEAESKASARRYGSGSERSLPGAADRERWGREGFPGD